MGINTMIGQVARGEDYFPRPNITNHIWDRLDSGSNLLLVAPRRVGKSSILSHLFDNPKKNYIVISFTSEPVNNENEFYKKLYHNLVEVLDGNQKYTEKVSGLTKDFLSRIESIGKDGISLGESRISYLNEFQKLIKKITWGDDKILVLIDEFAQTVENIIRDEDESAAIHFLESMREIRQAKEVANKLQFIFAGSIGLENIASRLNKTSTINDLASIVVTPLSKKESLLLIEKILNDSQITFLEEAIEELIRKIEWLIPFYFHLIIDEANRILIDIETKTITKEIIEEAINNALKHKIYFDPWYQRLRTAYKKEEFSFVKELLCLLSEKQSISSSEIVNLAVKYKLENMYTELLNALKHDGYINNNADPKIYCFNSPLLKKWWYCNVAN